MSLVGTDHARKASVQHEREQDFDGNENEDCGLKHEASVVVNEVEAETMDAGELGQEQVSVTKPRPTGK